eukprot:EG_transcript_39164
MAGLARGGGTYGQGLQQGGHSAGHGGNGNQPPQTWGVQGELSIEQQALVAGGGDAVQLHRSHGTPVPGQRSGAGTLAKGMKRGGRQQEYRNNDSTRSRFQMNAIIQTSRSTRPKKNAHTEFGTQEREGA